MSTSRKRGHRDETAGTERAAETEPVRSGTVPPSQSGYGHDVNRAGGTRPQGGANPVGPEGPDTAGRKGRSR